MSEMEHNKGRLIPMGIDTENFTNEDYETYFENGFVIIEDEVYRVIWEIKQDTDLCDFADVKVHDNGTIDFHTLHYNGGGYWTEVVEHALSKQ